MNLKEAYTHKKQHLKKKLKIFLMSEKLATFYNVVPGKTKKLIENTTPGSYLSFSKIV